MTYSLRIWHLQLYFLSYQMKTLKKLYRKKLEICPAFPIYYSVHTSYQLSELEIAPFSLNWCKVSAGTKSVAHIFQWERDKKCPSDEWWSGNTIFLEDVRSRTDSWESELQFISNRNNCLILRTGLLCPSQFVTWSMKCILKNKDQL